MTRPGTRPVKAPSGPGMEPSGRVSGQLACGIWSGNKQMGAGHVDMRESRWGTGWSRWERPLKPMGAR